MSFIPYENVPLYLAPDGANGEYIFAESASISVNQPLNINRQLNDNLFRICAYGDGSSLTYSSRNFNPNTLSKASVLLGPIGGPPQPLPTSYSRIEKDTKITFPNGKALYFDETITPNGHNYVVPVYAKDTFNLSEDEAQKGYYEGIYKYSSNAPIQGIMDVNFYINHENLQTFFNIPELINSSSLSPINEGKITGFLGEFCFHDAYLKSLSFSLSPNSLSQASASFDIYGKLQHSSTVNNAYFSSSLYRQQSIPHGSNSQIIGASTLGIDHPIAFDYNISVDRNARFECPVDVVVNDNSLIPTRVTKSNTVISMSIEGESLDTDLLSDGFNGKSANLSASLYDLNYSSFGDPNTFSENNTNGLMHTFKCNGVITSQSLSVNAEGHLIGSISAQQTLN